VPSPTPTTTAVPSPTPTTACLLFGDVDEDGDVDIRDVQLVAAVWRNRPADSRYDLDHDGVVTVKDIMQVVAGLGQGCL
jgi:hypothetical protein